MSFAFSRACAAPLKNVNNRSLVVFHALRSSLKWRKTNDFDHLAEFGEVLEHHQCLGLDRSDLGVIT